MIVVTVAESEVGDVQWPNLPKLIVALDNTDWNDLVVVTDTYFFRMPPPVQVELQLTVVPAVHSQNTLLVAVTPVRPVAFCAVELMPDESSG